MELREQYGKMNASVYFASSQWDEAQVFFNKLEKLTNTLYENFKGEQYRGSIVKHFHFFTKTTYRRKKSFQWCSHVMWKAFCGDFSKQTISSGKQKNADRAISKRTEMRGQKKGHADVDSSESKKGLDHSNFVRWMLALDEGRELDSYRPPPWVRPPVPRLRLMVARGSLIHRWDVPVFGREKTGTQTGKEREREKLGRGSKGEAM